MNLECPIITVEGAIKMVTDERPAEEGAQRVLANTALTHLSAALVTLEALRDAPEKTGGAL